VLEALGAKWNRKAKVHIFDKDAQEALDPVLLTGEVTTQAESGFFKTPLELVQRMIGFAEIEPYMRVLEPSAGGNAITYPLSKRCRWVVGIESNAELVRGLLVDHGIHSDFLDCDPRRFVPFDRVLMNPPFARQQDVKHVLHALKFLAHDGILVAIMSAGVTFRKTKITQELRRIIQRRYGSYIHHLPDGTFRGSGTMVSTVMVVITGAETGCEN
jgi:16S rRNA G966 N2-methylase RsmD